MQLRRLFLTLLLIVTSLPLIAQDATARVLGQTTDAQGALLPGVRVTATNTATGVALQVSSDKGGEYQFSSLPIGTYSLTAVKEGFATLTSTGYMLEINQAKRVDLKLPIAGTNVSVSVNSTQAAQVDTVNATIGATVSDRAVQDLPLNGRQTLDLALLQPGVSESNNPGNISAGTFSINGGRSDSVTFLLDGGVNNNLLNNGVVFTPNPDAVQEFRILESNYTAEYGRNGGGVVSVVTKSGTNSLHGTAYDYIRNDAANANSYFNKLNGVPRDVLKRNQYGATLGGPISVPRLYSGKDRLFFFTAYQGQRLSQAQNAGGSVTTFTPAELTGDFSKSTSGGPDPNVVAFLQQYPYYQADPALQNQAIFDPTKIDATAKNYIKAGLIPTSPTGVLFPTAKGSQNEDEITGKVDYAYREKDHFSGTYGWATAPILDPFGNLNSSVPYPVLNQNHRQFFNFAYTHSFSQNLLNEFRLTAQRQNNLQDQPAITLPGAAQLGVAITPDQTTGPPILGFVDAGTTLGFNPQGPTALINNTFNYSDNVTYVKGRHSLKTGFSFSPYQNNTVYDYYVNGEFFFYSVQNQEGGTGSLNGFADFLAGAPAEFLQFGRAPSNIRSKTTAAYVQDEFHISKNVVLSYGLRYEYSSPKLDTQGRSFSIIPGLQSTRFINAPNGLVFPGDKGAPIASNFPDKNDFGPRFGLAWDVFGTGKTSVRGGFGTFYDILKGEDNLQFNGQAPFFGFADILSCAPVTDPTLPPPTQCFRQEQTTFTNFADPYGTSGVTNTFPSKPPAKDVQFGLTGGGGVYFVDPHLRTPYTLQYNLSIQQDLGHGLTGELAYVGSGSRKLTSLIDSNPFPLTGPNAGTHRILNTLPGNSDNSYGYSETFRNVGHAGYNGLDASLRKNIGGQRFFGSSYFTVGYTLGKNLDNASGFRQRSSAVPSYDPNILYGLSDTDVRHRVVASGGWDLPFQTLFGRAPARITNGWSLYPIYTYRTGFPLDVTAGLNASNASPGPSGAGDQQVVRADLVGGRHVTTFAPKSRVSADTGGSTYLDVAQFATPATGYGTLGRNNFHGPSHANFDLALAKRTDLIEGKLNLEFRVEAYNLANAAEFQDPKNLHVNASKFGVISTTYDPRILQLAGRLRF